MEWAYDASGGKMVIKRYHPAAAVTVVGKPFIAPAAGATGLSTSTTTSTANMVGVNVETAAYTAAQNSDGSDNASLMGVIINSHAVWRTKMSGGATENTALSAQTVTTASTDGLAITTAAEWSSPTFDEGIVWGAPGSLGGANAGIYRKITSVSSTAGTVIQAFPRDTVVGDIFYRAPYNFGGTATVQLSTLLTQADASIAVGTGAAFFVLDMLLRGANNSFIFMMSGDHVFAGQAT
ncbi:MAG: hypothetical protein WA210_20295 [Burkholderiaceae bacterium]